MTIRHIPYHQKRDLNPGEVMVEEIMDDIPKGLRTPARSGYIYNSGPGFIEIKVFDGIEWGGWQTIGSGDGVNMYYDDNCWYHTIRIRASKTHAASYEITMNPGLNGGLIK